MHSQPPKQRVTPADDAKPWYRHRWPWILMIGPAFVVVAGAWTIWIAATSYDGLVADDYYKRGLAVNQTLRRVEHAAAMNLRADVAIDDGRAYLVLSSDGPASALPEQVQLRFIHPTRAGLDRSGMLLSESKGVYTGRLDAPREGRWIVTVEAGDFKLSLPWRAEASPSLRLRLQAHAD